MTIIIPAILFWLLVLIIYWGAMIMIISNYEIEMGLPFILIGWLGIFAYIIYFIYWVISHWHNIPIHINLT